MVPLLGLKSASTHQDLDWRSPWESVLATCRMSRCNKKPLSMRTKKVAGKLQVSSYQLNSPPLQGLLLSASLSVFEKNVNFSKAATQQVRP